jgi:nucleotide-binding universal stress UspA family protein
MRVAIVDGEEDPPMFQHILVPTDGSELAEKAVRYAVELAKEQGARITALTVSRPFHVVTLEPGMLADTPAAYAKHVSERTSKFLDVVTQAAKAAGVPCHAVGSEHEHPYQAIIDTAQNRQCDLIVMASHGRSGVAAVVLGSQTVKVLTHSKVPVLVYR